MLVRLSLTRCRESCTKVRLRHPTPQRTFDLLRGRLEGLTFGETPLSAISRFSWSPELSEARPLLKAARQDGSSFRADLEQSTSNERAFMKVKFHEPSRATIASLPKSKAVLHKIHTYTELRQQIHDDLRIQHPEWVKPNGESPVCDFYEARLMELLDADAKGLN